MEDANAASHGAMNGLERGSIGQCVEAIVLCISIPDAYLRAIIEDVTVDSDARFCADALLNHRSELPI